MSLSHQFNRNFFDAKIFPTPQSVVCIMVKNNKDDHAVMYTEDVVAVQTNRLKTEHKYKNGCLSTLVFMGFLLCLSFTHSRAMRKCFEQAFSHKPFYSYFQHNDIDSDKIVVFGEPGHKFTGSTDGDNHHNPISIDYKTSHEPNQRPT